MTEWGGGSSFREVAEVELQWNWREESGSGSCCNWKKIEDEIDRAWRRGEDYQGLLHHHGG